METICVHEIDVERNEPEKGDARIHEKKVYFGQGKWRAEKRENVREDKK